MKEVKNRTVHRVRRAVVVAVLGLLSLCLLAVAVSALSNLGLPVASQVTDRLAEAEQARLAEALHLREQLGDAAWPGWGQADIPAIVYNEAYAFLVRYPDPPPGWLRVPQNEPRGGPWEAVPGDAFEGQTYYRQALPEPGVTPQAFAVRVGPRWVGSMATKEWLVLSLAAMFRADLPPFLRPVFPYRLATRLLVGSSDAYITAVLHESFHAYQGQVAPERLAAAENAARDDEGRYPWDDADLQAAWQAELDTLVDALRASSDDEAADLARDFLALRAQRRSAARLDAGLIEYERQREWLEGLAKYAELEVWRQAANTPGYQPLPVLDVDPDFRAYTTFETRWSQEVSQVGRMAGDEGDGRFYYSGMAQAVLLDRLMPGWKERALQPGVWLEDLLAEAVE